MMITKRKVLHSIDIVTFMGALVFIIISASFMMSTFYFRFLDGGTSVTYHLDIFAEMYIEVIVLSFLWACIIYQMMKYFKPKVEKLLEYEMELTKKESYIAIFVTFVTPVMLIVIASFD